MRRTTRQPPWEPGPIPLPGGLLDWRAGRHYDHWQMRPCALCEQPTPLRSHTGEPAHKVCAGNWVSEHPTEARLGRFASDIQPKRRRDDNHA
ncbi:hypothetical protein EDD95_8136 [Streptomyces sp. CEV 2-1]|uniref:hypothetical protein n=1 Tax=Streptomyces sp. CEV 2-1 TaxID=2485153 RepID=UPI000F46B48A|nr:hypothetical protein [Streptomyces sp. CEV 2-1]ROQ65274.1 hypothetical protein EDD95_8136 [Streptomyces sp. CEV 2-1]